MAAHELSSRHYSRVMGRVWWRAGPMVDGTAASATSGLHRGSSSRAQAEGRGPPRGRVDAMEHRHTRRQGILVAQSRAQARALGRRQPHRMRGRTIEGRTGMGRAGLLARGRTRGYSD